MFMLYAECILKIIWVRFHGMFQWAEEKVVEIFDMLSPVLLSI